MECAQRHALDERKHFCSALREHVAQRTHRLRSHACVCDQRVRSACAISANISADESADGFALLPVAAQGEGPQCRTIVGHSGGALLSLGASPLMDETLRGRLSRSYRL